MKSNRKIGSTALALLPLAFLALAISALADVAPDATARGPLGTTSAEYRFPAQVDPDIINGRFTELWARVYRPTDLSGGPYPLVIFLHGNHATCGYGSNPRVDDNCQYSITGLCPSNYVPAPSHVGYSYMADRLASWGYIVVSINANRGINCSFGIPGVDPGLNLARGRLVLKHLQRLSEWNRGLSATPPSLGVSLMGKLDFSSVGLMGHSRGGEGVRAAYNLYRDMGSPWPARIPGVTFQGIFEIGPVDGQTSRVLNADNTVWNVLLPMCDGDVFNLQGIRPFDRMMKIFSKSNPTQKSTYTVWGANHNYYNTEWQLSDSPGCLGPGNTPLWSQTVGSPRQRQTALASVLAFFRGNVGPDADPAFNQNFNPQFALPPVVTSITRVDRGFTDSPSLDITFPFEDFDQPTGISTYGIENDASHITINHGPVPNHSTGCPEPPFAPAGLCVQRAGAISWLKAGEDTYFQTNWMDEGSGADVSGYKTLDLRVSRQDSTLNPPGATNFSIRLAQADGTLSAPVQLNNYMDLRGPVGGLVGLFGDPAPHPILQTVRIPLAAFLDADLTQIRGVRLTFDGTKSGAIYLANIRLSTLSGSGADKASDTATELVADYILSESPTALINNSIGVINSIRTVLSPEGMSNKAAIQIQVVSSRAFPVRDELAVLRIGAQEFALSGYPESGDTHALNFILTPEEFAGAANGDPITVQYGHGQAGDRWDCGSLDKSLLDK